MNRIQKILKMFNLQSIEFNDYINIMESYPEGREFMDLIDILDVEGPLNTDWEKIYNVMSKNIEISQLITCFSNYKIYKGVLEWFEEQGFCPESILDIGCNNGLFTIALSKLLGNVDIFGIDYALNAIKVAKKIAKKYKISNSHFIHADINIFNSFSELKHVDMIIVPFLFHEIISFQESNWKAINDNIKMISTCNTKLITVNRFLNIESDCNHLCAYLKESNFVELERDIIKIDSADKDKEYEYFPVQVFSYR